MMFIEAKNISFAYNQDRNVLNDISFSLDKGETLALVGASGTGKSTLLRVLSGILPLNKQHQLKGGVSIDGASANSYRQSGKLSFMFQEPTLMPNLTVSQNIELPLKITGINNKLKIDELLRTVGLSEFAHYLPKHLSGGMKTRVSLARSFITEPELLLLDEPFSALDISWKRNLYIDLESLREKFNTAVVIVTHDVQEALLLSDHVIVINRFGEIKPHYKIESSMSLIKRVKDISGFMKEVYENYMIPIQKAIMLDGSRGNISRIEVLEILEDLEAYLGDEKLENTIQKDKLNSIRNYANDKVVHEKLLNIYNNAVSCSLKYQLIWDILEYHQLPEHLHSEIFEYYFSKIEIFSEYSKNWYAQQDNRIYFETLKARIEAQTEFIKLKKWVYLCDLYAIKELTETFHYLNQVINGEIQNLNYPFAKVVAQKVKMKIENEKKSVIPSN